MSKMAITKRNRMLLLTRVKSVLIFLSLVIMIICSEMSWRIRREQIIFTDLSYGKGSLIAKKYSVETTVVYILRLINNLLTVVLIVSVVDHKS